MSLLGSIDGRLTVVGGHCFGIQTDQGSYLVAFPYGTQVRSDEAILFEDGTSISVGEVLKGAGGVASVEEVERYDIPPDCETSVTLRLDAVT